MPAPSPLYDAGEPSSAGMMMELYRAELDDGEGTPPDGFFSHGHRRLDDYRPLIESFGDLLVEYTVGDFRGDTFALVRDGDRFGILIFGWGSCSGCDALQACQSWEEIAALRDDIARGIRWFGDADEALGYVRQHDWAGDWTWTMLGPRRAGAPWIRTTSTRYHAKRSPPGTRNFLDEMEAALLAVSKQGSRPESPAGVGLPP